MAESDPSGFWRTAPMPATRVWQKAQGLHCEPNPAALAWARRVGLDDAGWCALAQRQLLAGAAGDEDLLLGAAQAAASCRTVPLPDGCLMWVTPDQTRLSRMVSHAEQVTLMTYHGRMGLVVRNLETGEGQWDRHVFRIFGLSPSPSPPAFEQALQQVHADDRVAFLQAHNLRTLTPGTHSIRFRIVRGDGELRYLNSLYSVRPAHDGHGRLLISLLVDETDSVLHDRAQRETQSTLATAVELAGLSIWRSDPVAGTIAFNENGLRMLGLAGHPGPLPLSVVRDMVHPEDLESVVRASDEALRSHHVVDAMARYRKPDGGWRHLLTRRFSVRDDQGRVTGLHGVSLDLSELVLMRGQSVALLDRIRLATEAIGVGFWWRDLDLETVEWDERMFRLHARDPALGAPAMEEFLARHVHPDDQAMMRARHNHHLQAWPAASEVTFRIPTPEGGARWIQAWTRRLWRDGRRLSFGLHVDVTDRREAEWRIEQERERDRFAIAAARVGVWEWPLDGQPPYWNAASYDLHGFGPEDARPIDTLQRLALTEAALAEAAALRQACRDGQLPYRQEYEVRLPGGEERWLMSTGQLLRDGAGQARALSGVTVDVTERHVAERLARERDRADQANAAKSELMARVSHELRTPMNAVLGFAELMSLDALNTAQQERLTRIRSAAGHLLGLIDDLLDLARTEAPGHRVALEPVALDELFHEAAQWVAPMARSAGVLLHWPGDAALASLAVVGERRRLGQVVTNLLTNAIKYNRPGGEVWVQVRPDALQGRSAWALSVRDNGRGMSPAQQARLFEPFNRLGLEREGIPGTGLGLSIARRLVLEMGGALAVHSTAGEGSTFTASFLCAQRPEALGSLSFTQVDNGTRRGLAGQPVRVLYVEDNPVNEMLVQQILAQEPGFVLHTAVDGCSGMAEARAWQPQIVLLDLQLPDLSGHEVLRQLKGEPALVNTRFVALSANAMPADIDAAIAQGFDAYWTKPLALARFLSDMQVLARGLAS